MTASLSPRSPALAYMGTLEARVSVDLQDTMGTRWPGPQSELYPPPASTKALVLCAASCLGLLSATADTGSRFHGQSHEKVSGAETSTMKRNVQ